MLPKFPLETQQRPATPKIGDPLARARQDCNAFCDTLQQRIAGGTLPPEEAYWWTQIAVEEVAR